MADQLCGHATPQSNANDREFGLSHPGLLPALHAMTSRTRTRLAAYESQTTYPEADDSKSVRVLDAHVPPSNVTFCRVPLLAVVVARGFVASVAR